MVVSVIGGSHPKTADAVKKEMESIRALADADRVTAIVVGYMRSDGECFTYTYGTIAETTYLSTCLHASSIEEINNNGAAK